MSSYNEWIKNVQQDRNDKANWRCNVSEENDLAAAKNPPQFPFVTLFQNDLVEKYAVQMSSEPTGNVKIVAEATLKQGHFAPCMVGALEAEFLKMMTFGLQAKDVLDVGTFTGMSAVAFAEGGADVVTLEFDEAIASTARQVFKDCHLDDKITLIQGPAKEAMETLKTNGRKFDVIFLDADKESYIDYYELALGGLLNPNGFIMADNALCSLLYDQDDFRSQKLHEFNQHVKKDSRVDQVVLTIREGVTLIRLKKP